MKIRLLRFAAWVTSRQGKAELGSLIGAATGLYTALHKAGVL